MRARAASKPGLSLTIEPPARHEDPSEEADGRRARYAAWGALLVSAAAIAGYWLGPDASESTSSGEEPPVIDGSSPGPAAGGID